MGGHSLGGAHGHIKAHGLSLFPHQRKLCTEFLVGLTCLRYARENTVVTIVQPLLYFRPELAVSVLEEGVDSLSLYGLVPCLLLLRSLVELGRGRDALDICLKIIAGWRTLDLTDVKTGVQKSQVLLLGSTAALSCDQYELAYLLAVRY